MLLNKDWDFETAIKEISKIYYPGGITTGPLRNRQVEAWGQLVGKTRALAEFDAAIKKFGSLSAFGREYRVTLPTLHNFRKFFENLPDDQVAETISESNASNPIKVFISYSWDNDDHKNWVRELATRLRSDGNDVTLDQWHLVPGDQLPEFMERAIRESAYVLIVCTHKYKERSDNRRGGVGYEGDIITAEFMTTRNQRKFIPILRQQSWADSAPNSMLGKYYIDFSSSPYSQKSYDDLLTTLLGTREKAPPIRAANKNDTNKNFTSRDSKVQASSAFEPIQITGIIADQVGVPRNDGTRGSGLYRIPFRLTQQPPREWAELFVNNWNHPPSFTTMHRPGIASVVGDTVVLEGTTIEEVKDYHRDTLVLVIQETNKGFKEFSERRQKAIEREQEQVKTHKQKVDNISNQIKFTDVISYPIQSHGDTINQAENLLRLQSFEEAYEILQNISDIIPQAGYVNLLRAMATLKGRTFNQLSPNERKSFEKHLLLARNNMDNNLLALILLAALEIDYYNYHGQVSQNNISIEKVSEELKTKQLSEEDKILLKSTKISEATKHLLGIG